MVFGKSQTSADRGWVTLPNGTHVTQSPAIIRQVLETILKEHIFCILLHKEYQSVKTVLVAVDDGSLSFDKPLDWPGHLHQLRVIFKDKERLWNQFPVTVRSQEGDLVVTTYPDKLLRLQRRASYRVEAPRGSSAMFMHKDALYRGFRVVDISAEGAQFVTSQRTPLAEGDLLADIAMTFPAGSPDSSPTMITVRQGRIRRVFANENRENCYGIHFEFGRQEEQELLQYVRQRERELLRKGLNG